MRKIVLAGYCAAIILIVVQSCVYNDLAEGENIHTDEILFREIITVEGYNYYLNGSTISPASASPHGSFKLRFNNTAWEALDNNGELPIGKRFPEGSVLVKEVYLNNALYIYAVMKKAPAETNAGMSWLWAEYFPDGSVAFGINRKGDGCISCHSELSNRDLVRTFDLH